MSAHAFPEIMIPLVSTEAEIKIMKDFIMPCSKLLTSYYYIINK